MHPADDPTSIGNLLKKYGVTDQDIEEAMAELCPEIDRRLGEVLVQKGKITMSQLKLAIAEQDMLRDPKSLKASRSVVQLLQHTTQGVRHNAAQSEMLAARLAIG